MKKYFIFIFIVALVSITNAQKETTPEMTLEDAWTTYRFYPQSVYGIRSMSDGESYTTQINNSIVKYSYETGEVVDTIFNLNNIKSEDTPKSFDDYEFSADENQILLTTNKEMIYRHSFKAEYYVYNLKTNKLSRFFDDPVQLATFSPKGDKIAFVFQNNIYYVDLNTSNEVQVTKDGKINEIINGAPDWVYEEEFSFSKAFEWSPDGSKIAFMRFDENEVKEYELEFYDNLYPTQYKFKYPKAGEKNSVVEVKIYNLATSQEVSVDLGQEQDQYIPRIKWTHNPNTLSFYRLNRLQNHLEMMFADAESGNSSVIYDEKDNYYIDITDNLTFLSDNQHFIITSEKYGFNHIFLYTLQGKLVNQITKGDWEVSEFFGYDEENDKIYFTSTEISPMERHLYSIKKDGTEKTLITDKKGTHKIDFSKGFKYFIDFFTDANTPYYISLNNSEGKEIRILQDNKRLVKLMKDYKFSKKEFFTFKNDEGDILNGWQIKPANFEKNKKYPVYMYLYGGPGSQEVNNSWDYNSVWHQLLAQKGYLVVCVDNRGTGGRGAKFKKQTYGQLGKMETEDQIDAAIHISTWKYADKDRISIQGWSYGGYMSSLCLFKGNDIFKCAIAVAPVTNWRYYDSIYTERYMGLPKDNEKGYDDNSPINHTRKLRGKYLLVHGLADDNVHFQNTAELVKKLIASDKQFDLMVYPNKNHGIYGGNTRHHLFGMILDFLDEDL
jgi:dipeptidyl-peptidase-4